MRVWQSTAFVLACVFLAAIAGCGGSPVSPKDAPATLGGNWSLFGPLPNTTIGSGPDAVNGIALTIQQADKGLVAAYSAQYTCGGVSQVEIFGIPLTGAVGDDGKFSLTTSTTSGIPYPVLEVSGTVPGTSGGGWQGSYTFVVDQTVCSQPFKGSFTATQIGPVTGTYTGITTAPGVSAPVTVVAKLTQGAMIAATDKAPSFYDASVITGGVTVSGVSCLTSGTLQGAQGLPFTTLIGNFVELDFAMNDGSNLALLGYEEDVTGKTIEMEFITDLSGSCQFQTVTPFTLAKQED